MTTRKNPVLLRRGPLSGHIVAITNYRRIERGDSWIVEAATNGKHDVTSDFEHLLLETLFPEAETCARVTAALDGVARDMELNDDERRDISDFRERIVALVESVHSKEK